MSTIGGVTPEPSSRWPVEEDFPGPWNTNTRVRGGCSCDVRRAEWRLFSATNEETEHRSNCQVANGALKRRPPASASLPGVATGLLARKREQPVLYFFCRSRMYETTIFT